MKENNSKRLLQIDFLRGIAVILVLFRHGSFSALTSKVGWIGVDLFFVLSGFLVGGLLFKEFIKTGTLKPGRFLIRRGFKIYPSFYFFLLITIIAKLIYLERGKTIQEFNSCQVFSEIFFVQNYFCNLWNHTWSLAVEEHFYLILTLVFVIAIKCKWINSRKTVRIFIFSIMLLCLLMRLNIVLTTDYSTQSIHYPTHLRMDSLFFGVLLADFYHYNRTDFLNFFRRNKIWLSITAFSFLVPVAICDIDGIFMTTFGFTLIYLAFGIITGLFLAIQIFSITNKGIVTWPRKLICTIGFYSYSIYLWHMFVATFFMSTLINSVLGVELPGKMLFLIYFIISVLTGIIIAKAIELPMLRIREKYFPPIKNDSLIKTAGAKI